MMRFGHAHFVDPEFRRLVRMNIVNRRDETNKPLPRNCPSDMVSGIRQKLSAKVRGNGIVENVVWTGLEERRIGLTKYSNLNPVCHGLCPEYISPHNTSCVCP